MNRKKDEKPMNRKLEPILTTPTGGEVPRCQAHNAAGNQCGSPARKGYSVCWKHGAGSKKREDEGTAKVAGRPLETGVYAKRGVRTIHAIMAEVEAAQEDLDNTDKELAVARAVLWNALELHPDVDALMQKLATLMDSPTAGLDFEQLMDAARMVSRFASYLDTVQERALKVTAIVKARADITAKTAQTKALEQYIKDIAMLKAIMQDAMDRETYERVFEQVQTKVLGPRGVRDEGLEA